ncbi:substrate-binding periplasmic protein [Chitinimonas naiadis]
MLNPAVVAALLLATALGAQAASPARYGCSKPVNVAYMRFGFLYGTEVDGRPFGFDVDLIAELTKRTGCRFIARELSRVLIFQGLQEGQLDMATAGLPTREREAYLHFLPYLVSRNRFILPRELSAEVHTPDEFLARPALKLGVVRGFIHGEPYDDLIRQLRAADRVMESPDVEQLYRWLKLGRIQGLISHPIVMDALLVKFQLTDRVTVREWAKDAPAVIGGLMLARRRFSPEALQHWDELLRELRRDGTIEQLFARYVDAKTARALTPLP